MVVAQIQIQTYPETFLHGEDESSRVEGTSYLDKLEEAESKNRRKKRKKRNRIGGAESRERAAVDSAVSTGSASRVVVQIR